jgi:hypothetical protein
MRRHARARACLVAVLVGSARFSEATAFAQTPPVGAKSKADEGEARARYEKGQALYKEGAFEAALVELQRAYELAPSYKILYNIAQVHRQLNDFAGSLKAFERYLAEGDKGIAPKRKQEVDKEIAELKEKVGSITVSTTRQGGEILLDDVSQGMAPLPGPLVVNPGTRKITLSVSGNAPVTRAVTIASGESQKVELEIVDAQGDGGGARGDGGSSRPPPPPARRVPTLAYVGWGATGLFAVGAGVTGFLALSSSRDLRDKRQAPDATKSGLESAADKTKQMALISDVCTGVAVVAAGVSLYLTVKGEEVPATSARQRARLPVDVGFGPGSVSVSGAFLFRASKANPQ